MCKINKRDLTKSPDAVFQKMLQLTRWSWGRELRYGYYLNPKDSPRLCLLHTWPVRSELSLSLVLHPEFCNSSLSLEPPVTARHSGVITSVGPTLVLHLPLPGEGTQFRDVIETLGFAQLVLLTTGSRLIMTSPVSVCFHLVSVVPPIRDEKSGGI